MDAVDESDLARLQRHDHGGGADTFSEEADAFHKRAVGDAGGGKNHLLARRQVLGLVDAMLVLDAHLGNALFQLRLVDDEPPQHIAVQAANGGGGDDSFGRSAGAHDAMHASADDRGRDAGGEVAVADELDAGAGLANVRNELLVAGTVEHNDYQVINSALQPASNILQIVGHGGVEIYRVLA